MANIMPFLVMSKLQAARFKEETANDSHKLDPREITVGVHKGKYALPRRVMDDPNFASRQDAFLMLEEVALDIDEVFYVPEEE